jgi:PKD repeat protein
MAAPTAQFTYIAQGLEVVFTDTSIPNPDAVVAWAWTFGSPSILGTASVQNPSFTFPVAGTYTVILTVTDSVGMQDTISLPLVLVDAVGGVIGENIFIRIPPSLFNTPAPALFIKKWQHFLANQKAPELTGADIEDQDMWEYLENLFIAELTVYEVIMAQGSTWMASGNLLFDPSSETTNNSVKKIKTGPDEGEWWDNQKNQADFFRTLMQEGGALDKYKEYLCLTAKRLGFYVDLCDSKNLGLLFRVAKTDRSSDTRANTYLSVPSWLRG